jgi:hypothetical protein
VRYTLEQRVFLYDAYVKCGSARKCRRKFRGERVPSRQRYVQIILGQFFPELTKEERLYGWFQQDSATAHTARMSMQALSMSLGTDLSAVVCGQHVHPILHLVIFLLWGCLKDKVYKSNPQTEEQLKENIRREIANIPAERLQRVNQNLFRRCEECVRVEVGHFQHLL